MGYRSFLCPGETALLCKLFIFVVALNSSGCQPAPAPAPHPEDVATAEDAAKRVERILRHELETNQALLGQFGAFRALHGNGFRRAYSSGWGSAGEAIFLVIERTMECEKGSVSVRIVAQQSQQPGWSQ